MRNYSLFVFTLFLLLCSFSNAQQSLLQPFHGEISDAQQQILSNLLRSKSVINVQTILINSESLKGEAIKLKLGENHEVVLERVNIGYSGISYRTWTGVQEERLGSFALLMNGNRFSGHFTSLDGNFEIAPLGDDGLHMLFEHDNSKFDGCGTSNTSEQEHKKDNRYRDDDKNDKGLSDEHHHQKESKVESEYGVSSLRSVGTECFIRLVIGYTSGADANTAGTYGRTMSEHVSLAVLDQNLGNFNAGTEQRVELAYLYSTNDNESASASTDVAALKGIGDGKWDEIHTHRNNYDGDMCALITDGTYSGLCGIAFGFDYTDATNFFQLSEYNCIVGNFTMAHEFGHCQGLRHDTDPTTTPFSYGHGYNQGSVFRTIMAVSSTVPRVNYWSNPLITFPGGGGAMGVAGTSDNTLALNSGDNVVAHHRSTPSSFTTTISLGSEELLNMLAVTTLNSGNKTVSGSKLQLKSQGKVVLQPGFHARSGSEARAHIVQVCTASYSKEHYADNSYEEENKIATNDFDFIIYPNPANEFLNLDVNVKNQGTLSIKVFNIQGQLLGILVDQVKTKTGRYFETIDISSFEAGLYYLQLISGGHTKVKRFVVQY